MKCNQVFKCQASIYTFHKPGYLYDDRVPAKRWSKAIPRQTAVHSVRHHLFKMYFTDWFPALVSWPSEILADEICWIIRVLGYELCLDWYIEFIIIYPSYLFCFRGSMICINALPSWYLDKFDIYSHHLRGNGLVGNGVLFAFCIKTKPVLFLGWCILNLNTFVI